MRNPGDQPEIPSATQPNYPSVVRTAGIIWIVFGALIMLNLAVLVLLEFGMAASGQKEADSRGAVSAGLLFGLFGAVFIHVGFQSVQGKARDTLGNGIGSIIFGVLNLGMGIVIASFGLSTGRIIQAGISSLAGAGLMVAGVLALVGRSDYKAWRAAQKVQRGKEKFDR